MSCTQKLEKTTRAEQVRLDDFKITFPFCRTFTRFCVAVLMTTKQGKLPAFQTYGCDEFVYDSSLYC
jgi:hypothetical protein